MSFSFLLFKTGITVVFYQACFTRCWGLNPGFLARKASNRPTELHSQHLDHVFLKIKEERKLIGNKIFSFNDENIKPRIEKVCVSFESAHQKEKKKKRIHGVCRYSFQLPVVQLRLFLLCGGTKSNMVLVETVFKMLV